MPILYRIAGLIAKSTPYGDRALLGSLLFGAIADDLTGAVELAGMLAAGGARTALVTDEAAIPEAADAVVIALRSRVAPRAEAVARFRTAADALGARGAAQLFFKYCATFDSTAAGNIGPCADVLAERGGSLLFCPSFPEAERTVYRGHLFVGDVLVSRSPKRLDPLTPMTEPDLVQVLQPQTEHRVGLLPLACVAQGASAIRAHAAEQRAHGVPYLIADAVFERDLRAIAAASWDWPAMTGGSSIAAHYPSLWREAGRLSPAPVNGPAPVCGHAAVLAGSYADRTREQIDRFAEQHPVLRLDLRALGEPDQAVASALDWAKARLPAGPLCISTAASPDAVAAAQDAFGIAGAASRAETLLSEIARGLQTLGVRRLLVAGGETSGAVVQALGISRLAVAPYAAAGIGTCTTEAPVPMALCLKSGKLGPVDMFARTLAAMGEAA